MSPPRTAAATTAHRRNTLVRKASTLATIDPPDMRLEVAEEYLAALVAAAPPITEEQAERLRSLLPPARSR
jgi:hypothetical protein